MYTIIKNLILEKLLLNESYADIQNYIQNQKDEDLQLRYNVFFGQIKTYSEDPSKGASTLIQAIKPPFFKWLFSIHQSQNRSLDDILKIANKYLSNKDKIKKQFDFKNKPPEWENFEGEVITQTSDQTEKLTEKLNIVQLISKEGNTRWIQNLGDSKVNNPEIVNKFKNWNENSTLTKQEKENNILVVEPRTTLSAKFWGNPRCFSVDVGYGVKWCTSAIDSRNYFREYTAEGSNKKLIYIIDLSVPDADPWQKIAVLIKSFDYRIYDAHDKIYYHNDDVQNYVKPEIFQIINKIINKYSKEESYDQYLPSQFNDLSPEEKHTLFLTTLRDQNSEDKEFVVANFKNFFNSQSTTDHDRKRIIYNTIGSSDYDDELVNLISDYLTSNFKKDEKYSKIVDHLNTEEKKSKAVEMFYSNSILFAKNKSVINTDHWKLFKTYLTNEQKHKIAIKFILKEDTFFQANWNDLSEYLTDQEKSIAALKFISNNETDINLWNILSVYLPEEYKKKVAEKFFSNLSHDNFPRDFWNILSEYLPEEEKRKLAQKFIVNINYFDEYFWGILSEYLPEEEKRKLAQKFIVGNNIFRSSLWNILSEYLSDEEKRKVAKKYILNDDNFDSFAWRILSEYLPEEEKRKVAEKFVAQSDIFDKRIWIILSEYLPDEEKRKVAEKFVLNSEKFNKDTWLKLSSFITEEEKIKLAEKFPENISVLNVDKEEYERRLLAKREKESFSLIIKSNTFDVNTWNNLSKYLSEEEKRKVAEKFVAQSDIFDVNTWNNLSKYLSDEEKRKVAEKFIIEKNQFYLWNYLSRFLSARDQDLVLSTIQQDPYTYYGESKKLKLLKLSLLI
jgi:hypothetical protein